MTEKQRLATLNRARAHLKRTKQGFDLEGSEWQAAWKELEKLEQDFKPSPIPALGPMWNGGKSVLLHDLTHATSGIPLFPAFDDAFNQGRIILAPEAIKVIPNPETGDPWSSANPGEAFYSQGASKLRYWFGHLDRNHPVGTKFAKGAAVGKVAANNVGGGPHVHVGINVELLLGEGKQLKHHTDYTHGAPLIGVQLRSALQ